MVLEDRKDEGLAACLRESIAITRSLHHFITRSLFTAVVTANTDPPAPTPLSFILWKCLQTTVGSRRHKAFSLPGVIWIYPVRITSYVVYIYHEPLAKSAVCTTSGAVSIEETAKPPASAKPERDTPPLPYVDSPFVRRRFQFKTLKPNMLIE